MKDNKTKKEEVTEEFEPLVALIRDIKRKQLLSDEKNDKTSKMDEVKDFTLYTNEAKRITINWKKNKETSLIGEEENGL